MWFIQTGVQRWAVGGDGLTEVQSHVFNGSDQFNIVNKCHHKVNLFVPCCSTFQCEVEFYVQDKQSYEINC